jgi:hypothetical protein
LFQADRWWDLEKIGKFFFKENIENIERQKEKKERKERKKDRKKGRKKGRKKECCQFAS